VRNALGSDDYADLFPKKEMVMITNELNPPSLVEDLDRY